MSNLKLGQWSTFWPQETVLVVIKKAYAPFKQRVSQEGQSCRLILKLG